MRYRTSALALLALGLSACGGGEETAAPSFPDDRIVIDADGATMAVTPHYGGRITHFAVDGHDSVVFFNDALAAETGPVEPDPTAPDGPYYGHSVWVAPQTKWWADQTVNPDRDGDAWPPDPWLTQGSAEVLENGDTLILQTAESPLSGIQYTHRFRPTGENRVALASTLENVTEMPVEWGVWFNTRVQIGAHVYAPAGADDVRLAAISDLDPADLPVRYTEGLMHLSPPLPDQAVEGKLFVTAPRAAGWMAAFYDGQCFIIRYPATDGPVHPEQSRLEFYMTHKPDQPGPAFIEMELHTAFAEVPPGGTLRGEEEWQILPFDGPATADAQIAFLRRHVRW